MTNLHENDDDVETDAPPTQASQDESPLPWQMIEPGRYQPRRIKGSCVGRELG